jgi:hypothetical protein
VDKNRRAVTAHADRAVLLAKGRVVFDGAAESLAGQPELLRQHLGRERPAPSAWFGNPAYAFGNREPGRGSYCGR